jgi:hypothetical protein
MTDKEEQWPVERPNSTSSGFEIVDGQPVVYAIKRGTRWGPWSESVMWYSSRFGMGFQADSGEPMDAAAQMVQRMFDARKEAYDKGVAAWREEFDAMTAEEQAAWREEYDAVIDGSRRIDAVSTHSCEVAARRAGWTAEEQAAWREEYDAVIDGSRRL